MLQPLRLWDFCERGTGGFVLHQKFLNCLKKVSPLGLAFRIRMVCWLELSVTKKSLRAIRDWDASLTSMNQHYSAESVKPLAWHRHVLMVCCLVLKILRPVVWRSSCLCCSFAPLITPASWWIIQGGETWCCLIYSSVYFMWIADLWRCNLFRRILYLAFCWSWETSCCIFYTLKQRFCNPLALKIRIKKQ